MGVISKAPKWLLKLVADGSARAAKSNGGGDFPIIKTRDHPRGQRFAKLLGAKDRGTYWSFDCPGRHHVTPNAAMYPRANGEVYFKCWSSNPCSHQQIAAAIEGMSK